MATKKYINTAEVAELTRRTENEIRSLASSGVLPAHKSRRGRWRFNVDAVEKYFGIQINCPVETDEKTSATKPQKNEEKDVDGKLICGHTARKYLKCSKVGFETLVDQGIIQAYRDEYNRWKVSKESIISFAKRTLPSNDSRLILNEEHYQEVIQRICAASSSIKIMTANFKRFNLKPIGNQGKEYEDGTPFIKYLMAKAVQGVSVQIVCSKPSPYFSNEWKDYYRQMMNPKLFEYKYCERNHAKVVIVDDKLAYVGSANVTPAGLGQGIFTPGNFEIGIITNDTKIIAGLNACFHKIMNGGYCEECHRSGKYSKQK